jgi:hypothetical protein
MPPGFGRILCTEDVVEEALVNFGPAKPERRVVLLRAEELSQDEATESCFLSRLAENPSLGRFVSPKRACRDLDSRLWAVRMGEDEESRSVGNVRECLPLTFHIFWPPA